MCQCMCVYTYVCACASAYVCVVIGSQNMCPGLRIYVVWHHTETLTRSMSHVLPQCPDGLTVTNTLQRRKRWGAAWRSYYELQVRGVGGVV